MNRRDATTSILNTAPEADANRAALVQAGDLIPQANASLKSPDDLKIAGIVVAGLAALAVAATLAYRKHQREKPLSRLQHLKAQLGLSDADFKELKARLSKLDLAQLKELSKAAW